MTIDLSKERVNLNELKMSTSSTIMVDGDVIVPDIKPDIREILLAEAFASVNSKEVSGGKLNVSGQVRINILYAPDTEDENLPKVKNMTAKFDFRDSIDCLSGDVDVTATAMTEHVEFSIINSRKINMKVAVKISANAYSKKELTFSTGVAEESGLEARYKNTSIYNIIADEQKEFVVSEVIEIPASKCEIDEILKMDIHTVKGECKLMNNKIMLKGTLGISTLYSSLVDGYAIEHAEHEAQFAEIVDIEGLSDECMCNVKYDVKDVFFAVREDLNGEMRAIALEVVLEASIMASCVREISVLDDCYSPFSSVRIDREKVELCELINEGNSWLLVKDIMKVADDLPQIDAVYHILAKPVIVENTIKDGKLMINGNLAVFLLYVSKESNVPLNSIVCEFPFVQTLDVGECEGRVMLGSSVAVDSVSFTLNAASEVEIRCNLEFYTKVLRPYEVEVISGGELTEYDEAEDDGSTPRLIIYFVQQGDTMWDIAKRYRTTYGRIMSANKIEDASNIFAGQKLLIPKV